MFPEMQSKGFVPTSVINISSVVTLSTRSPYCVQLQSIKKVGFIYAHVMSLKTVPPHGDYFENV